MQSLDSIIVSDEAERSRAEFWLAKFEAEGIALRQRGPAPGVDDMIHQACIKANDLFVNSLRRAIRCYDASLSLAKTEPAA